VIIKTLFFKIIVLLKTKSYSAMREKSSGFSDIFKNQKNGSTYKLNKLKMMQ